MKLKVYCFRDLKAEVYLQPFFLRNHAEAIRVLRDLLSKEDSNIGKYPEDFSMFCLASWNDEDAKLDVLDVPELVGHAIDYVDLK